MKIKLIDLKKDFFSLRGKVSAVDNINLEIYDNEFFVLLGPSGCGKSTILNLIAGLETPASGEIWFDEQIVSSKNRIHLSPKYRKIGMVFQNYALYPHLTVFENIAFPLRIQKKKGEEIEKAVQEVANVLEIKKILWSKPAELSGGERQRVAIGRAIVRKPSVLLLDEPLSNLDARLRLSTRTELKSLQRKLKITTVYVTHDQIEAMTLGDRIAILKDGKLVQIGTPLDLYENPANAFIATFLGSPPMNLISVACYFEEGRFYFEIANKKINVPEHRIKHLKYLPCRKNLLLGIRPEDIFISSSEHTINAIQAVVRTIESLGREIIVDAEIGSNKISILTDRIELREGDLINVEFNLHKVHFFEQVMTF